MRMKTPKRRVQVEIKLGADSMEDALTALRQIVFDTDDGGGIRPMISGGYNSGYTIRVTENLTQTHEGYIRDLQEYKEQN